MRLLKKDKAFKDLESMNNSKNHSILLAAIRKNRKIIN